MRLQDKIISVHITPFGGEHSYDLSVEYDEYGRALNDDMGRGVSNFCASIDDLQSRFPNLKDISLVVGVYATLGEGLSLGSSKISALSDREAALYGWNGTPTDSSLVSVCNYLGSLGYNVRLYPMLFVAEASHPWRGHLVAHTNDEFAHFFNQYNECILHYAHLLDGYVDSMIIGSEFVGLTENNKAVSRMLELASQIKAINPEIKLTYAANFDEYQNSTLHDLWSSEYIDSIGIDAYFPLSLTGGWDSASETMLSWYLQNNFNKQIEFTEIGFPSHSEALAVPYNGTLYSATPGNEYMQEALEMSFDYWNEKSQEYSFLPGAEDMYVWHYDSRGRQYYLYEDQYSDAGDVYLFGHAINDKI